MSKRGTAPRGRGISLYLESLRRRRNLSRASGDDTDVSTESGNIDPKVHNINNNEEGAHEAMVGLNGKEPFELKVSFAKDQTKHGKPNILSDPGETGTTAEYPDSSPELKNIIPPPEKKPPLSDDDYDKTLEGWQPMEDAFNDPNFNSYLGGPGSHLARSHHVQQRSKGYVKLHVGNVPKNLSKKAIDNIFSSFGKPIVINLKDRGTAPGYGKYSAETTYAFVVFATLREAHEAMVGLNEKEPFKLKVSFAKDQTERGNPDIPETGTTAEYPDSFWDKPCETPPNVIHGKPPSQFRPEGLAIEEKAGEEGLEKAGDELYEQGIFSKFLIPRAIYLHNRCIKSHEEKMEGVAESQRKQGVASKVEEIKHGDDVVVRCKGAPGKQTVDFPAGLGECVLCGDIALVKCGRCGARYCCATHLKLDLERHKPLCIPSAWNGTGQNGADSSTLSHRCQDPAIFEERSPEFSIRYSFLKLGAGASDDIIEPESRFEHSENWQSASALLNLPDMRRTMVDEDFFVIPPPTSAERMPDDGVPQPPGGMELAAKVESSSLDNGDLERGCSIPGSVFTEVTIVHREGPGDFWVLTNNGIRHLLESARILNERSPRKGSVVSQLGRTFGYHHNGIWCRIVLTKYSPFTGFLIDFGYTIEVCPKNLLPLDSEMEEYPPLAIRIRLADDSPADFLNKKVNDSLTLKTVKKLSNRALLVSLKNGIESADYKIPAVELPPKGLCCLTAYHTPQVMYVRPLTPKASKIFDSVVQDVAAHCLIGDPMEMLPKTGELVGACWTGDNNFHRALVMGTAGKKSQVIFLDFGNIEKVSLDNLRHLPVVFKKVPATAVKIGLRDVHHRQFNLSASIELSVCIKSNSNMTLEHDGDLSSVKLFIDDSSLLNESLNRVLMPSHMSETGVLRDYYDSTDTLWIRWKTSVIREGLVTNVLDFNKMHFVCNSKAFDYVREVMTPQITEYCKSLKMERYVPRYNEFILVRHEGDWYRALICDTDPLRPFSAKIFLVDYGNTGEVPVEDIRPMAPEFALVPATAKLCIIQGLPPRDAINDHCERIESLVSQVNQLVVLGPTDRGPHECYVYVPSLEEPLAELGVPYSKPANLVENGLSTS